jgi:hypothetical protein
MNLEKLESTTQKVSDFQKKYNDNSKSLATFLGNNLTLLLCMLIPVLLVAFVWTEFGDFIFQTKMLTDGIVTIVLFACGEMLMVRFGSEGGKLDSAYIGAKAEFEETVKQVIDIGTKYLGVFCDWQIDTELEQATRLRLRQLRMTPKMWDSIKHLSLPELEQKFGKTKARKLMAINELEPIELNEAVLLYNGESEHRGSLPKSADEHLHSKKQAITSAISLVFTGLLTVSIAISHTTDISWARVIYTAYKLTMLLFRMMKGYERGAIAFNTHEARRYQAKTMYLKNYVKFVENKTYLDIADKYEELSYLVKKEEPEVETA